MMRRWVMACGVAAALLPSDAAGQASGLAGGCAEVDPALRPTCAVAAQAISASQAQVGILVAGGNPTIGTASTGGLGLAVLPGVTASVEGNLVAGRLPDLRQADAASGAGADFADLAIMAPSLSATVTLDLFRGVSLAPTVAGLGAVQLLGSASWLPLQLIGRGEFTAASADVAWGGGARIGIVRESFTLPGASISIMRHRAGTVGYGTICPTRIPTSSSAGRGYEVEQGGCVRDPFRIGAEDVGEGRFDLDSWSTRAVVSKQLLGLALAGGVGYDRFTSEVAVGARRRGGEVEAGDHGYAYVRAPELSQDRWSLFANGSYSLLVASLAAEVGWMQGGDTVDGYPLSSSDFAPDEGSFFGSLGLRVAL